MTSLTDAQSQDSISLTSNLNRLAITIKTRWFVILETMTFMRISSASNLDFTFLSGLLITTLRVVKIERRRNGIPEHPRGVTLATSTPYTLLGINLASAAG